MEAAFLFPCVFFVIIGLLYLSFYLHDKVRIQSDIDETIIKATRLIKNEADMTTGMIDYEKYNNRGIFYFLNNNLEEIQQTIKNYLKQQLKSGLFIATVQKIKVTCNQNQIDIEVSAKMNIPFLAVREYFTGSGLVVQINTSSELQNPVEFIRIFDVYSEVANRIGIINNTLRKIQSIVNQIH